MSHQQIIQTLIEWIDDHIDQPLNIDVVAKKSGYSKWYLQRMFRTVMHQTLGEYIRQRRLLLAAQALRSTQRPIFDIAMDLGYVSQQTFSRVFRREFDRTPSDYRHQLNSLLSVQRLLLPGHKFLGRHRFREVPSLTKLDAALQQPAHLLCRLDPFRNGFQPQALRHLDNMLGDQVAGAVGR